MTVFSDTINFFKSEVPLWGSLVKFSHSIFALPFALSMFLIVAKTHAVTMVQLLWIVAALVSARTAAMGFNRILDRHIDSLNPRTINREIPSSKISCLKAWKLVILSSIIFLFCSWELGNHCLLLSPLVLGFLFFYSYTKRFTKYAHFVLGAALALAPGGVWYALTAEFAFLPLVMMIAVMFWVAGFDIIYSCQDVDFDKSNSLYSFPAVLGTRNSLMLAKLFHLLTFLFLIYFGYLNSLGLYYFTALMIFASLLINQHLLVNAEDLSKADSAFFTRNGAASFIYFLGVFFEYLFN
jgi:4-hydroxybenzoate polyprenyltransferase